MFVIIGIVVVLGCVLGGFVLEHGHLGQLLEPIELLIIGGAAFGAFLISSPKSVVTDTIKSALGVFGAKEDDKKSYLEIFGALFELMNNARRNGVVAIEPHVTKPEGSSIFGSCPGLQKNKEALNFICDNFKVLLVGNIDPNTFESIMDLDIATRHHHHMIPSQSVSKVADSLPGLGIVAAVLGVVLTMSKINEPPDVLGHSIGAALVGTFLGVLLCYGFVGPVAANLEHIAAGKAVTLKVIRACLTAYSQGLAPALAIEAGRRAIPGHAQPSFEETEEAMKAKK